MRDGSLDTVDQGPQDPPAQALPPTQDPVLPPDQKAKLDGIVQKMVDNNESDQDIRTIIGEFKEKYKSAPVIPDHQLQHTSLTDARYLQGQINSIPDDEDVQINGGSPVKKSKVDPDFAAQLDQKRQLQQQYAGKITDISQQLNVPTSDVLKVVNDFPNETNLDHLKANVQMMNENPAAYIRLKAQGDIMRSVGSVSIHAANQINHLQDIPNGDLGQLESNIAGQKDIINNTLTGDARTEAIQNLAINRGPYFNALNPQIRQNLATDQNFNGVLDNYQYAGLQYLKNFDPARYDQTVKMLSPGATNAPNTDDGVSIFDPGALADPNNPAAKIEAEKLKKNLLDIGLQNTQKYLQEHQANLNDMYEHAGTDQEKEALVFQWNQNKNQLQAIQNQYSSAMNRFPYLQDLEFDRQAKELRGASDNGPIGYMLSKFGSGVQKAAQSLDDISSNFRSDAYQTYKEAKAGGEAIQDQNNNYLVQGDKDPSVISYKFDPQLTDAATKIKKDTTLTEDQKNQALVSLVKNNPDKVQTVTDPSQYGKTANFFSKATVYKTLGMIGDVAPIALEQFASEGAGLPKLMSSAVPMYLNTEHDFYKEGVSEGVANPSQYALVHSAIMMAAAMADPQLDIAKKSFSINSDMGKALAGVTPEMWDNVIKENGPLLSKIRNSIGNAAKETGKAAAIWGAGTSIANDVANKTLFNQPITDADIASHAAKATTDLVTAMAPVIGLGAAFNIRSASPEDKARLWDLGENSKLSLEAIDHAIETGQISSAAAEQKKQVVKTVADLINKVPTEDSKGKPLSDQDKTAYLYNLIIKKNISDHKANVSEFQAQKLADREKEANLYNTQIVAPELTTKAIQDGLANVKIPENSPFKTAEGNGPELVKQIQQHITGNTEDTIGSPLQDTRNIKSIFPSYLVDAAIRNLPDDVKRKITDAHDLADATGDYKFPSDLKELLKTPKIDQDAIQEQSPSSVLQHPQSGVGEEGSGRSRVEPSQQGKEITTEGESEGEKEVKPVTVGDMVGKSGLYKGKPGIFDQDGQTVIFKERDSNREYELGNVDEVKYHPISDYGIETQQSKVTTNEKGQFIIEGQHYINAFENKDSGGPGAIATDKDGNVVSVKMKTPTGKPVVFKGDVAEDLAYQIHLKEINKSNERQIAFEDFINTDEKTKQEINNARLPETTAHIATPDNEPVSRTQLQTVTPSAAEREINELVNKTSSVKLTLPDIEFIDKNFNDETDTGAKTGTPSGETSGTSASTTQPEDKTAGNETGTTQSPTESTGAGSGRPDSSSEPNSVNDNGSARLTIERDKRISEETKPDIEKDFKFVDDESKFLKAGSPEESFQKHSEIRDRIEELKKIINCLW